MRLHPSVRPSVSVHPSVCPSICPFSSVCLSVSYISSLFVNRFGSLAEPCSIRRENLEDALLLYTFFRDVDDEMSWIREKRPIAAMTDLGTNLQTVQSLQKKHQVIIFISAFF